MGVTKSAHAGDVRILVTALLTPLTFFGCTGADQDNRQTVRDGSIGSYPDFVDPMTPGEAIPPFAWPVAIDGSDQRLTLDLVEVFEDRDQDLDWSPFDQLLFVSIPAW